MLCCSGRGRCAVSDAPEHTYIDYCSSCRETLSAALLRCCCRATRANVDLLRTRCIRGRHQQRGVRFDELLHGALELRSIARFVTEEAFLPGGEASRESSTVRRVVSSECAMKLLRLYSLHTCPPSWRATLNPRLRSPDVHATSNFVRGSSADTFSQPADAL